MMPPERIISIGLLFNRLPGCCIWCGSVRSTYAWRVRTVVAQGEDLGLRAAEVDHEVDICISKSVDASTMIDTGVYVVDTDDIGAQRFQKACVEFTLRWISQHIDIPVVLVLDAFKRYQYVLRL